MTELALVVLLIVFVVAGLAESLRVVRRDGYGVRPAPHGIPDWGSGALPSRPFADR